MNDHLEIAREYRQLLSLLSQPGQNPAALSLLQMGWLTPGCEVLERLENQRLTPEEVSRSSKALQRKWFGDLEDGVKGRWISIFREFYGDRKLQEILQLTLRRLQQLQKLAKCISPEGLAGTAEPIPETTKRHLSVGGCS